MSSVINRNFRFILDRSSQKYICPNCRKKTFVLYVDQETSKLLPSNVGRCDRQVNCAYSYTPKQYFAKNNMHYNPFTSSPDHPNSKGKNPVNYIDDFTYYQSTQNSLETNLGQYLISQFGKASTEYLFDTYPIGRSYFDNGKANIFYRIDEHDRVRSGKIMSYNPITGKRNKDINTWLHADMRNFNFKNCFFGQHLIYQQPYKPIAITESEKTAMICTLFIPEYLWVATGGITGIKFKDYTTISILENREIILFPDFGKRDANNRTPYDKWCSTAKDLKNMINCEISVSTFLEKTLPVHRRSEDVDLADVFLENKTSTPYLRI